MTLVILANLLQSQLPVPSGIGIPIGNWHDSLEDRRVPSDPGGEGDHFDGGLKVVVVGIWVEERWIESRFYAIWTMRAKVTDGGLAGRLERIT